MPVDMLGEYRDRGRIVTGLYSLDKAFENPTTGELGVPMSVLELFGPQGCGKTTLSWFLVAEAAKLLRKNIVMMMLEVFDPKAMKRCFEFYNYDGKIYIAGGETDESMMDDAYDHLKTKDYSIYVLDSIGAISPIAELSGDSGAANMGRRARLVNPHVRKLGHLDRNKDVMFVLINHVHPNLGDLFIKSIFS